MREVTLVQEFDHGLRIETYATEAKKCHISASVENQNISNYYCLSSRDN